jgi:hypothetical protein
LTTAAPGVGKIAEKVGAKGGKTAVSKAAQDAGGIGGNVVGKKVNEDITANKKKK